MDSRRLKSAIRHDGISFGGFVVTPLLAIWCFILHRLTGEAQMETRCTDYGRVFGLAVAILLVWLPDPRGAAQQPETGDAYFEPSLARTASGGFIPEASLMNDAYCEECHAETHARWKESSHKFSSFNNILPFLGAGNAA